MSPALAASSPKVILRAQLQPEALGGSTSVSIGFQIHAVAGESLPPLRSFGLRLPVGMGFASSTLGIATCSEQALLAEGAGACPPDSVMGIGNVRVGAPFANQQVTETANAKIFMTQLVNGNTTMLFYMRGLTPVIATLLLQTQLLTPVGSLGSVLSTEVPVIPTEPGSGDITIKALRVTIGPRHLRYYKRVRGHTVVYRPVGLNVPERCPRGGFVFIGEFGFEGAGPVLADASVPCPHSRARSSTLGGRGT